MGRIVILAVLFSFKFAFAQVNEVIYPSWFLYPDSNTIVGYSSLDSTCLDNAAKRKAVLDSCVALGSLYFYEVSGDSDFNKNSDYYYYYPKQNFDFYKHNLVPLDSFVINVLNNDRIKLFSPDSAIKFSEKIISIDTLSKPSWVDSDFYEKGDFYYSVGEYTSIGRDNDAWTASEEKALFNLIRNTYHKFGSIQINIEKNKTYDYEKIIEYKMRTYLKSIKIVQRYPDLKNKIYYTLIKIKKGNIKSLMEK